MNRDLQCVGVHAVTGGQSRLIAARGLSEVAYLTNPPADVLSAIEASCGVAKGVVEHVHDDARVAEIAVC